MYVRVPITDSERQALITAPVPNRSPLQPAAFVPLPLGSVRPLGWLLRQCRIQADGLTGHLETAWPDLGPDNMWLGGKTEGWERGPYYLDGLVPLAHVLGDRVLLARAQRWVDSILTMQDADGWIGPIQAPGRAPYDQWPVFIVLKALTQHHEATGDERVIPFMTRFFGYLHQTLDERPLRDWGQHRWADAVLSVHWLYNRTGDEWLLDVAGKLALQGYDWRMHFEDFRHTGKTPRDGCVLHTHVVNNAMAVKTCGVWWRQSGDAGDRQAVYRTIEMLDRYHGQATGIFTGDEHYAGLDPTQGTELCAVVEYMFSLEELIGIMGDAAFSDRLERIAYNALPGTFTADMWAHQYDQQANQALCTVAPRHWTNNNDDSNIFGLEPNFGCCTANYHQGWPKFVSSLWMATPDGGLATTAYGPCEVNARIGGVPVKISADTQYPFDPVVRFTVDCAEPVAFPLVLRKPAWADEAVAVVLSARSPEERIVRLDAPWTPIRRTWEAGDEVAVALPMAVREERRYRNAIALHRGPLVFSLRIGEERRLIAGEAKPAPAERSPDWEIMPTTPWNYALCPSHGYRLQQRPAGDQPFDPSEPPVIIRAKARRVPEWGLVDNSAGPTPESPVASDAPLDDIELIPYGCANLRITEFPTCEEPS